MNANIPRKILLLFFAILFSLTCSGCLTTSLWQRRGPLCESHTDASIKKQDSLYELQKQISAPMCPSFIANPGLSSLDINSLIILNPSYNINIVELHITDVDGHAHTEIQSFGKITSKNIPVKVHVEAKFENVDSDEFTWPSDSQIWMDSTSWLYSELSTLVENDNLNNYKYSLWAPFNPPNIPLKSKLSSFYDDYVKYGYNSITATQMIAKIGSERLLIKGVTKVKNGKYNEIYLSVNTLEFLTHLSVYRSANDFSHLAWPSPNSEKASRMISVNLDYIKYSQRHYYENENTMINIPIKVIATPVYFIGDTLIVVSSPIWWWFVPHFGGPGG